MINDIHADKEGKRWWNFLPQTSPDLGTSPISLHITVTRNDQAKYSPQK